MVNKNKQEIKFSLLLHDIRSVQNVASIFRLADSIGAGQIYLSGVTPGPLDRFDRVRNDFVKISLGSEIDIIWGRLEVDVLEFIRSKKVDGYTVIALEQSSDSINYKDLDININSKYLIIPGREREGLEGFILNSGLIDHVLEIKQYGQKESLNIFSALSILLYRLFDR
jgi:23S rRNA (guanosine2251-2'-O)-methyltransferase